MFVFAMLGEEVSPKVLVFHELSYGFDWGVLENIQSISMFFRAFIISVPFGILFGVISAVNRGKPLLDTG